MPWCKQISQTNPTKKLGTDAVQNHIDHFRAVLRGVVVHTERSLAKGGVDHFDDSVCNPIDIRIRRHDGGETLEHVARETLVRTRFVFSDSCFVCGRTGMREVVRATGEGARNNDGGLDPPPSQFTRVDYGQCIHPSLRGELWCQIGW